MIVSLASLSRGDHELSYSPAADELELDDRFSDLEVKVYLSITGSEVVARIVASSQVRLTCDRTLKEFETRVSGTSTVLGADVAPEDVDGYDDVVRISSAEQTMNLNAVTRDTLLLAVPSRAIAPGEEESPIPTVFADDDEDQIDPRWEDLKKIK